MKRNLLFLSMLLFSVAFTQMNAQVTITTSTGTDFSCGPFIDLETDIPPGDLGLYTFVWSTATNPGIGVTPGVTVGITDTYEVEVTEIASGLVFGTDTIDITILDEPLATIPVNTDNFELCDGKAGDTIAEFSDGQADFNLIANNVEILNGQDPAVFFVSYHTSMADAMNDVGALPNMYNSPGETIFARVDNASFPGTTCNAIVQFDLVVFPNPGAVPPGDLEACDPDNDGIVDFEDTSAMGGQDYSLTQFDATITGGDPTLTVTYHVTEQNAIDGVLGVTDGYTNVDPYNQQMWARVTDIDPVTMMGTGCFNIVTFNLIVWDTPMPNDNPLPYAECDDDGDDMAIFDLRSRDLEVLGGLDPAIYSVTWFALEANAINEVVDIPDPLNHVAGVAPLPSSTIVYARVTNEIQSLTERCFAIVELELIVNPIPVPVPPMTPYELCDDVASGSTTDGFSVFDLDTQSNGLTGGNPNWGVDYFLTEALAENNDPADVLMPMYTNSVSAVPETLWARVEDISTGCFETISITLVVNPNPTPVTGLLFEECDDESNDGIATFNLGTDLTDPTNVIAIDVVGGEAGVSITFYETQTNAETPMSPLPAAYDGVDGDIYARIVFDATGCVTIVPVTLEVNDSPTIDDMLEGVVECDLDGGALDAIFDFTDHSNAVYGTTQDPVDFALTYHETLASAEDDTDPGIADITAYPATTGTLFARLVNRVTGCFTIQEFTITAVAAPVFGAITSPIFACDDGDSGSDMDGVATFDLTQVVDEIQAGNPNVDVFFYVDAAALAIDDFINDPLDAYQNPAAGIQTLLIRIQSTEPGMCNAETQSVDLVVNPLPVLVMDPLPDATTCDIDNNTGFGVYNLDDYELLILNGQLDVTITFYETETDANNEPPTNEIMNTMAYNPLGPMVTLYARAENNNNMLACAKVFEFDLEANPVPVINNLDPITQCDVDEDGVEIFNLTVQGTSIITDGGLNAADYTFTYHTDLLSAEDDTPLDAPYNPIPTADIGNYVQAVPGATLFIRMQNNTTECFAVASFDIIAGALPTLAYLPGPPPVLEECDDDYDGITEFDLTEVEDLYTGGDPLVGIKFFRNAGDIVIDDFIDTTIPFINEVAGAQSLIVILENQVPCEVESTLLLRVKVLPSPDTFTPEDIIVCDTADNGSDNDGIEDFNLTAAADEIDSTNNTIIRFFETEEDANNYDELTNLPASVADATNGFMYTNTASPNEVTLYARVNHSVASGRDGECFVIVPLNIIVNPLPVIDDAALAEGYVLCEVLDADNGTVGNLNLSMIAGEVGFLADPQMSIDFDIDYFEQQAQAEADFDALDQAIPYPFDEGVFTGLWVRVENTATKCFRVIELDIAIESSAPAFTPGDLMSCENIVDDVLVNGFPIPGVGTFDLTEQDEEIIGGPLTPEIAVIYYASQVNLNNGIPIANPSDYVNESNSQVIWAQTVLTNPTTTNSCPSESPVFFTISVKETPYTNLNNFAGVNDICVDPATGDVLDPVTLDATPESINQTAIYSYAWTLDGAPLPVTGPEVEVTASGVYQATVTATYTDSVSGMETACPYTAEATFNPISAPLFEVQVVEDSFNTSGLYTVQIIESSIVGFGSADYEFSIDDGPFQDGLTFTNVRPGNHIVFGRRKDGFCAATPVLVGIIDYPRFFTPNSDGFHDTWNILGLGSAPNLNSKIYIFDRYGKLLKQLSPTSRGWDGTFNGAPLPSSDYWFRVEYIEPGGENAGARKQFAGHFTLKR